MIYNPNYRDQIFWESEGSPSLAQLLSMMKTEFTTPRVPLPKSPLTKISYILLGALALIVVLTASLTYVISRSVLLTLVYGMSSVFLCMGILFITLAVFNFFIYAKRCTVPVKATVIGYSITGGNSDNNSHNRILRTPVFKYTYDGLEYIAYDPVYENHNMPPMNFEADILIDPSDPSHLKWEFDNRKAIWIIAGGIGFILMACGFLYLTMADAEFKAAALNQTPPAVETQVNE